MRKLILSIMVSVDGYIEAKDPSFNWHNWDEEMAGYMMGFFKTLDMFVYGRKAYEDMIAYWPRMDDDFAQVMNNTPKLVLSKTLKHPTWNSTVIKENVAEGIKAEKSKPGKDLVLFGGAETGEFLMANSLIDEFRLIVNPLLLGGGKTLFKERNGIQELKLKEVTPFKCGNVLMVYEPKKLSP